MRRTKLVVERLEPNKGDRAQICFFGDLHLGSKTFDRDAAEATVARCVDKRIYVVGMGDMIECATRHSIGAGVYEQTDILQGQMEQVIDLLQPVQDAGLLLGMHEGN